MRSSWFELVRVNGSCYAEAAVDKQSFELVRVKGGEGTECRAGLALRRGRWAVVGALTLGEARL